MRVGWRLSLHRHFADNPVKPRSCSLPKCGSAEKIAIALWISCTTEVVIETRGLLESVRCRLVRRLRRKRADGHERTPKNMCPDPAQRPVRWLCIAAALLVAGRVHAGDGEDWPMAAHDYASTRYSP